MPIKKIEDESVNKIRTGLVQRTEVPPTQKVEQSIFPRDIDPIHPMAKESAANTILSSLTSSSMVSSKSSAPCPKHDRREIGAIQKEEDASARHTSQHPVSSSKMSFLKQLSNKKGNSAEAKEDTAIPTISEHFAGAPIALIKNRMPPPLNLISINATTASSQNTHEPEVPLAPRKIKSFSFPLFQGLENMHSTSDMEAELSADVLNCSLKSNQ